MSGKNENNAADDIPPTFYDKIDGNIIIDLTKLIELVIQRYKILILIYFKYMIKYKNLFIFYIRRKFKKHRKFSSKKGNI